MREAQAYLTRRLRERDLGRDLEGAKITLNEYLDRWLETADEPECARKPFKIIKGCCTGTSDPFSVTEFWLDCDL
jgi:hypothetical protein